MNNKDHIKEFIINRIYNKSQSLNVQLGEIEDDMSLTGSGIFDSMDFMVLIADVESTFNIRVDFTDKDPEEFTTLSGFINCIR